MKSITILILLCLLASSTVTVFAQQNTSKIEDMTREQIMKLSQDELLEMSLEDLTLLAQKMGVSIDELLKTKTSVASKTALTPRETPGIVSIISEQEIRLSGARDLIDVLRLVPGFDFGYDVQGVVGVGLRGNWVHEGKILMLIDGQEMNEASYNNLEFGNHFSVDQIKRIEIIRGPGSSIYGGAAELGVINIITKSGEDISGVEAAVTYGQLQNSMGRENINLNAGTHIKTWDISAKGFIGLANRSDQLYINALDTTTAKDTVDFSKEGSDIKSKHFNIGVSNKNLSTRLIYDDYKTEYMYFDTDSSRYLSSLNEFRTILGEIRYTYSVNDKFSITPTFNYKFSRPYYEKDYWRDFNINRYVGNLSLNYSFNKNANIVAGIEYLSDHGKCIYSDGIFYSNNSRYLTINNLSTFIEGIVKIKKLNIILGGRAQNNSNYGWAFAPRLGITGVFNKFHFKTLVSGAFRSPSIGNIDLGNVNEPIKPEKSLVSELELGYKLNENMFVTANIYDINIYKSITYYDNGEDSLGNDLPGIGYGYINSQNSGSDGIELEYRVRYLKGFATINYSYYTIAFKSMPDLYEIPDHDKAALGLSMHKINLYGSYMPVKNLAISPSMTFNSERYGYNRLDTAYNAEVSEFKPYCLLNLSVSYNNLFVKGLNLSLSVFDLLDRKPEYIQPYNGQEAPYPNRSREIVLKISMNINTPKK
jgi:outer membrane receptor for ferrienterochelin and colicin